MLVLLPCALFAQMPDTADSAAKIKEPPKVLYRPADQTPPPAPSAGQKQTSARPSQNSSSEDYLQGKMDGQRDVKGSALWFVAGLPGIYCYGIGCLGVLGSALWVPDPPVEQLMGKSTNYILGYTEGYKSKGKRKNIIRSGLGCITGSVVGTIIYLALLTSMF